jgi:hypothetical protein
VRKTTGCLPGKPRRGTVAGAAFLLCAAVLLGGCGASKDKNGFSARDRADALDAVRAFDGTGVAMASEVYTGEMGQPSICQIRLESRSVKRFRVFIMWTPKKGSSYGYAWLEAVSANGLSSPTSLHTGTARNESEARAQLGDALERPSEACGIRIDGAIVPAEH